MDETVSRRVREELKRGAAIVLGAFLYAVGLNLFVVPAGLYTGGVMGACQVIRTVLVDRLHLFSPSFDFAGILNFVLNVPLLILGWRKIDRAFVLRTLLCVGTNTLFLTLIPVHQILSGDPIASCLVGGVVAGSGVGIVLWGGGTGGGMDIVGMIVLRRNRSFSVGRINLLWNVGLYAVCTLLFNVQTAIYYIVYSVIFSFSMDRMHAQNIIEEVTIITKEPVEALESDIFQQLHRGVTKLPARGGYTDEEENMLLVVISKYETSQLISMVRKYDPHAFVTVKEHAVVYGNFNQKM